MKKIIYSSLLICLLAACSKDKDDTFEVFIPDEGFYAWCLSSFDRDGDGQLTLRETMLVKEMDIPSSFKGLSINSIKGIEYFGNLQSIKCVNNSDFDKVMVVQDLYELTEFYCYGLGLNSLAIKNCPKLTILHCQSNNLESIDIASLESLQELNCSVNNITSIEVNAPNSLKNLICSNNFNLRTINLEAATEIEQLWVNSCRLSELDIQYCNKMSYLDCSGNNLTGLDVNECPNLQHLECYGNNLLNIGTSKLNNLKFIDISNNDFLVLDISQSPYIKEIYCQLNPELVSVYIHSEIDINNLRNLNGELILTDISSTSIIKHRTF